MEPIKRTIEEEFNGEGKLVKRTTREEYPEESKPAQQFMPVPYPVYPQPTPILPYYGPCDPLYPPATTWSPMGIGGPGMPPNFTCGGAGGTEYCYPSTITTCGAGSPPRTIMP